MEDASCDPRMKVVSSVRGVAGARRGRKQWIRHHVCEALVPRFTMLANELGHGRGGCTHFKRGRRLETILTLTPLLCRYGERRVFHRPGRHRMHQARRAVRCSASRMKGELHPLPRTTCEANFRTYCVLYCMPDDCFKLIYFLSGVAIFRDSNGDTMSLPRGCLNICTLLDTILRARSQGPPLCTI